MTCAGAPRRVRTCGCGSLTTAPRGIRVGPRRVDDAQFVVHPGRRGLAGLPGRGGRPGRRSAGPGARGVAVARLPGGVRGCRRRGRRRPADRARPGRRHPHRRDRRMAVRPDPAGAPMSPPGGAATRWRAVSRAGGRTGSRSPTSTPAGCRHPAAATGAADKHPAARPGPGPHPGSWIGVR